MKLILILLPVLLVFLASCKDKVKKPSGAAPVCTQCQTAKDAKDFFYFKVGSWWVYEEETSHLRDSMYVTEANENPDNY